MLGELDTKISTAGGDGREFIRNEHRSERNPLVRSVQYTGIEPGALHDLPGVPAQLGDKVAEPSHCPGTYGCFHDAIHPCSVSDVTE
jgi:hypothetical protein